VARTRRVLLHHFSFKGPVTAAAFSPDGSYVAVAVGKLLQVRALLGWDGYSNPQLKQGRRPGIDVNVIHVQATYCGWRCMQQSVM
jgi:hypothetical protein